MVHVCWVRYGNNISKIENLSSLTKLDTLWLNDNSKKRTLLCAASALPFVCLSLLSSHLSVSCPFPLSRTFYCRDSSSWRSWRTCKFRTFVAGAKFYWTNRRGSWSQHQATGNSNSSKSKGKHASVHTVWPFCGLCVRVPTRLVCPCCHLGVEHRWQQVGLLSGNCSSRQAPQLEVTDF